MDLERTLEEIASSTAQAFAQGRSVLSFSEYLELLAARPYSLTRNAAQYARDVYERAGSYEVPGLGGRPIRRWRLYDDLENEGREAVYGHEEVQDRLYEVLSEFVERGRADRLILLHGPNGSAKSSILAALVRGMEHYSALEEGALYRISWIFCEASERTAMGFHSKEEVEKLESYAHVDQKLVTSQMPCEMRDLPLFLIPKKERVAFLERALEDADRGERERFRWTDLLREGDLSPKNRTIHDTLLRAYGGDWRKVMRHVRIERWTISARYRTGAVTIEPQTTIDASSRMLTHAASAGLPPILAHAGLSEAAGDLVEANGGIVEYSDFLKRNMEANKYLLTTAERGSVNLASMTISLNVLLFGSTNEKYLSAFKGDPSFASFKGRFELVRVPYLRRYEAEARIYERHLGRLMRGREIAPHLPRIAALWVILTRLRRPQMKHYEDERAGALLADLSPRQKAELYQRGNFPTGIDADDLKRMRAALPELIDEYDLRFEEFEGMPDAAYEGRRGASAREIMTVLTDIALNSKEACIGPVQLFEALPRLVADPSLYSFLRIPSDGPYHDPRAFIDVVKREYVRLVAEEVRQAADLVEGREYLRLFQSYLQHVRALLTAQKVVDPKTNESGDPDPKLMREIERHLVHGREVNDYRRSLMDRAAAWKVAHPEGDLPVEELFGEQLRELEHGFFKEHLTRVCQLVEDSLALQRDHGTHLSAERVAAAEKMLARLEEDYGYSEVSRVAMLGYFSRHVSLLDEDD